MTICPLAEYEYAVKDSPDKEQVLLKNTTILVTGHLDS